MPLAEGEPQQMEVARNDRAQTHQRVTRLRKEEETADLELTVDDRAT
jgi:hypothetical protein